MTRRVSLLVGLLYLIASVSVVAAPKSKLEGTVSGFELCPQSLCSNGALFVGTFTGKARGKLTSGPIFVQVTHESLKDFGEQQPTLVTGGSWIITTNRGTFSGTIQSGQLTANADQTFDVILTLEMTQPFRDTLTFVGELDHSGLDEFPPEIPTFIGTIQ